MKNYIFACCSLFENDVKQFKIVAEDEYNAVKKGMLAFSNDNIDELAWQASPNYPTDINGLFAAYEEIPFSVIEVSNF